MTNNLNYTHRIVLVTGSRTSITLIHWLIEEQLLVGVIIQKDLSFVDPQFALWLNARGIATHVVEHNNIQESSTNFLEKLNAELVLVFGFSWILPKQLLECVPLGFFNIHFSLLPTYKGPTPLFWQIKNGEKQTGISIHRMIDKPDAGLVVLQVPIAILEGEFMGFLHNRLSILTVGVVKLFLEHKAFLLEKSIVEENVISSYQSRPTPADLRINWQSMDAKTIHCLVQAANPVYGGAICLFREQELRLVEVKQVGLNHNLTQINNKEGLISMASESVGILISCCCGESLEIKIVNTFSGTMSGALWKELQQVESNELLY